MLKVSRAARKQNVMRTSTARQFNGGLDVADSELNLSSKYARVLNNILPGIDGSLSVRQGTREFANVEPISASNILDITYFSSHIIVINELMEILAVTGNGVVSKIWDAAIALSKGKTIWAPTTYVKFDEFKGNLIISDGVNKPLNVTSLLDVDYLADLATGSNINVPVSAVSGKFNKHFVYAIGSTIYVSERDAAGTWFGDLGAVYVGQFDLGAYVTSGDTTIIAMQAYKGFLAVYFKECIVPIQFNEVSDATPPRLDISVAPDSVIASYGTTSPKTLQDIGTQALAMDIVGVSNVTLTNFTKILAPDRPSRLVDKLIQKAIGNLDTETLRKDVFSVYDRRLAMYMMFLPNDVSGLSSYTRGFGYRYIEALKINAWCTYSGWNWKTGTRSSEGRIFLVLRDSMKIWVLGDEVVDPIYTDFETPTAAGSGLPIPFTWELPATDLKERGITKTLKYITLDVEGTQQFDCLVFVDNKYAVNPTTGEPWSDGTLFTDEFGFEITTDAVLTPALRMTFVGKDNVGWSQGDTSLGVNSGVENNTYMPTKFKIMKLRFEGETRGPLKFVAITLYYQGGKITRFAA